MASQKIRGETDIWFAPTRISVKDFGPIGQADIELRPLTVLMGPNDTGKTYMAMLLLAARTIVDRLRHRYHIMPKSPDPRVFVFLISEIVESLEQLYSVNGLSQLVREGAETANIHYTLKASNPPGPEDTNLGIRLSVPKAGSTSCEHTIPSGRPWMPAVVIAPSERSGILRAHDQLTQRMGELLSLLPHTSRYNVMKHIMSEGVGRIRLQGCAEVLLAQVLGIDRYSSSDRALKHLEDILQGFVELGEDLSIIYTRNDGLRLNLTSTSSMVSEVSAIYILTALLYPGSWFIIEEPEAHLHPNSQVSMARFLTALVRLGVNVLITTHSDLIVRKLGNMVGLAQLKARGCRWGTGITNT